MTPDVRAERYLAEVSERLPGSDRARADVIDELRDGLYTAADRWRSADLGASRPTGPGDPMERAVEEFGEPEVVATELAREIRLRLARRDALVVLLLLLTAGLTWQVYAVAVGVAAAMVPTGPARPVFLAGAELFRFVAPTAQVAAVLAGVAASSRSIAVRAPRVLGWLSGVTVVATVTCGSLVVLMWVTIAPEYRGDATALGVPVGLLSLAAGLVAWRARGHAVAAG